MNDVVTEGVPSPLRFRYGPNTRLVERLFSRLRMLSDADLDRAVARWHELVGPRWFAAERVMSRAIAGSGRHAERSRALHRLHELVARRPWLHASESGSEPPSSAGVQYVVTTAVIALTVRDCLPDDRFALLYAPFALIVPLAELDYDLGRSVALAQRIPLADAPPASAGLGRDATGPAPL